MNNKIITSLVIVLALSLNSHISSAEEFEFKKIKPTPEIIKQAKSNPNTWVYVIDGDYNGRQEVPQRAIVGSWQVDAEGKIMKDSFLANPNYKKTLQTDKAI